MLALAGLGDDVMRLCEAACIVSVQDMDTMEGTTDFCGVFPYDEEELHKLRL
jgi:hypothetical protein